MTVWKPVTQELPDTDTTVLIACADGSEPAWFGWYDDETKEWYAIDGGLAVVTHWAELPEPPSTDGGRER